MDIISNLTTKKLSTARQKYDRILRIFLAKDGILMDMKELYKQLKEDQLLELELKEALIGIKDVIGKLKRRHNKINALLKLRQVQK